MNPSGKSIRSVLQSCRVLAGQGIPFLVLIVGLAGCATTPAYLLEPTRHPHPDCAPATHFWAVGMGASEQAALSQAKGRVSAQVSSQVRSETQLTQRTQTSGRANSGRSQTELNREIVEESTFSHAELIEQVGVTGRQDASYLVLACLDRAQAAAALEADQRGNFLRVLEELKNARAAASRSDTRAFTALWRTLRSKERETLQQIDEIARLRGTTTEQEDTIRSAFALLTEQAAMLRAQTRVLVRFQAAKDVPLASTELPETLRQAIADLGLIGELTQSDGCSSSHGQLLLSISPMTECRWGRLGHRCALRLPTQIYTCGDDAKRVGEGDLAHQASANHPRDERLAVERAQNKAKERLPEALHTLLSSELPLL